MSQQTINISGKTLAFFGGIIALLVTIIWGLDSYNYKKRAVEIENIYKKIEQAEELKYIEEVVQSIDTMSDTKAIRIGTYLRRITKKNPNCQRPQLWFEYEEYYYRVTYTGKNFSKYDDLFPYVERAFNDWKKGKSPATISRDYSTRGYSTSIYHFAEYRQDKYLIIEMSYQFEEPWDD